MMPFIFHENALLAMTMVFISLECFTLYHLHIVRYLPQGSLTAFTRYQPSSTDVARHLNSRGISVEDNRNLVAH